MLDRKRKGPSNLVARPSARTRPVIRCSASVAGGSTNAVVMVYITIIETDALMVSSNIQIKNRSPVCLTTIRCRASDRILIPGIATVRAAQILEIKVGLRPATSSDQTERSTSLGSQSVLRR